MTTATGTQQITGTYTLDPAHTRIGFVARHAMVTKVRGSFNEFEGTATIDGDNPARSSARVTIQAASIDTRNADRDAHLRSNDFVAMDEFPQITFVSSGVTVVDETTFELSGDLTIKGVTHPVELDVEYLGTGGDPWGGTRAGFEASTVISRKEWGIDFNIPLDGGKLMIGDKITVQLNVEVVLQPQEALAV